MPRPVIHQDIIDQVIYALRDDRAALRRCCTVSHSFLIPSLKQLFYDIEINYPPLLNGLIHVLSIHPEYLSYIRILCLSWLEIETVEKASFIRLIEDLANRRVLRIFTFRIHHSWEALSVPIQAALIRLFQCPSLHTINSHMCRYTFPVSILGLSIGLRHLNFFDDWHNSSCRHPAAVSPMIIPSPSAASHEIYLESIKVGLQTNAPALVGYLSRPNCPLKISQLRELRIRSHYPLATAAAIVMNGASRSLESFIWVVNGLYGVPQSSVEDGFES